jgi:hypothetical protein
MTSEPPPLHAFIDESGQRARSRDSSNHFIMAAAVVADEDLPKATKLLADLRQDLNRQPGHHLTWKNLKQHSYRVHVAKTLGEQPWLTVSSVVVCKPYLTGEPLNDDRAYLYTLRYLLERLSWLARDEGRLLHYTMAHVRRFQIAKLREYERRLRRNQGCSIAWDYLDPHGGRMDQPQRLEQLQLGDLAASAIAPAFNTNEFGDDEPRYLRELSSCLYRHGSGPNCLTSYGLKLHPTEARPAYPWVADL